MEIWLQSVGSFWKETIQVGTPLEVEKSKVL